MIAWAVKFLSGFALWKGEKLGKFLMYSVAALVVFGVLYKVFLQKEIQSNYRTVVQSGGKVEQTYITNTSCPKEDAVTILKLWKVRLLSWR